MEYIVIDLEWNQSPLGRETGNKLLPFEIIEIGAVKLDRDKNIISKYSEFIKPQVYNEIHYKTKEIIHIDMTDLYYSDEFSKVIKRFFEWCGEEVIFCTWGSMDLTELERNMNYYNITGYIDKPIKYYDIQKLFSIFHEKKDNPRMLEYAVDFLDIKKERSFHRALNDAIYATYIFQTIDTEFAKKNYSLDYFHNPKTKEEEIKLVYDNYSKEISMEFENKETALLDKDVRSTICFKCGKKAIKKIRWFSTNSKTYYCLANCKEHGNLIGKIHIKKTLDDKIYMIKTLKIVSDDEANFIKKKKEEVRIKRRKKRFKKRNMLTNKI